MYAMMGFMWMYRKLKSMLLFQLYETEEFDGDRAAKRDRLMEVDFKEGGAFLAEPELDANLIPGVLSLFASIVKFEPGKKTEWAKDTVVYDALPAIFFKFSENSCVDYIDC